MKRVVVFVLLCFIFTAVPAKSEAAVNFDLGIWGATTPVEDYVSTWFLSIAGLGGGMGIDLKKVGSMDLQLRLDVNGYSWGEPDWRTIFTGVAGKNIYTRAPVFAGVRFYTPKTSVIKAYADGGIEISSDVLKIEEKDGAAEREIKDTNLGLAVGVGVELEMFISLGLNLRAHFTPDSKSEVDVNSFYLSFGPTAGLSF